MDLRPILNGPETSSTVQKTSSATKRKASLSLDDVQCKQTRRIEGLTDFRPLNLRLYEDGKYSDLHIETSNKIFRVHKALICLASTYFRDACENADIANNGVTAITVDEEEDVMEIVLKSIYDLGPLVDWSCSYGPPNTLCLHRFVKLHEAVDKYIEDQVPKLLPEPYGLNTIRDGISREIDDVFWAHLKRCCDYELPSSALIELAAALFADQRYFFMALRLHILDRVARAAKRIVADDETWAVALRYPEFLRFILQKRLE